MSALQESEQLASEVLAKRAEVVDLDRKRNKNREALRLVAGRDNAALV